MMNKTARILIPGLLAVLLSGCVVSVGGSRGYSGEASWQQLEQNNRQAIARLVRGMPVEDVRGHMGTPHFLESFERDGYTYEVLFYRTHRVKADGITTRDETTPVVFENGYLIGWGEGLWYELTGRPLAGQY